MHAALTENESIYMFVDTRIHAYTHAHTIQCKIKCCEIVFKKKIVDN